MKSVVAAASVALATLLAAAPVRAQDVTLNIWAVDKPGQPAFHLAEDLQKAMPGIKVVYREVQF
ncbi:hypothetical protein KC217_21915, partial [Mycobacterium tuberculosis]|nr:hypothetical protein [Mycobacterium tuberculosis]